jgi:putative copper resistance protein D
LITPTVLRSWSFDPLVALGLVVVALAYTWGLQHARMGPATSSFPRWRAVCFFVGLVVTYLALQSPIHAYSHRLFSVHMVQHLLLMMVAAPLLVLGTPVVLALRATSPPVRKRALVPVLRSRGASLVSNPVVCWSAFTVVLWASHFTSLYEDALGNQAIHGLEHVLYLVAAVLFWRPVIGLEPGPSRISHPARILYLFLAMPQMAFLGLAIYSSDTVLYPHYLVTAPPLGTSAVADQHLAGVLMWTTSMVLLLPALGYVWFDWMKKDEREAARLDARLDRQSAAASLASVPPIGSNTMRP